MQGPGPWAGLCSCALRRAPVPPCPRALGLCPLPGGLWPSPATPPLACTEQSQPRCGSSSWYRATGALGWGGGAGEHSLAIELQETCFTSNRPHQLQHIQATASSTGIQAREAARRARGAWGVASLAPVQATVHGTQRFLLGTRLLVRLFPAEGKAGRSGHCCGPPSRMSTTQRAEANGSGGAGV